MTKPTVPSHASQESELADTTTPDRRVAAHQQEMLRRGAAAKGEGRPR